MPFKKEAIKIMLVQVVIPLLKRIVEKIFPKKKKKKEDKAKKRRKCTQRK